MANSETGMHRKTISENRTDRQIIFAKDSQMWFSQHAKMSIANLAKSFKLSFFLVENNSLKKSIVQESIFERVSSQKILRHEEDRFSQ